MQIHIDTPANANDNGGVQRNAGAWAEETWSDCGMFKLQLHTNVKLKREHLISL